MEAVKTTLTIPDNVPDDVLTEVQRFIDLVSKVDAEGGIDSYGMWIVDQSGAHVIGIHTALTNRMVGEAVRGSFALASLFEGD